MNSESQIRGYAWWQWVLGVLTFWPAVAMLIGTIAPSTRPALTPKRIWIGYGIFVVVGIVSLVALAAVVGSPEQATPRVPQVNTQSSQPAPAPAPRQHPLVEEFGCQWIMDTYRPMTMMGRDGATMHVSNSMNSKRFVRGAMPSVTVADAAAALRECEAQGFQ